MGKRDYATRGLWLGRAGLTLAVATSLAAPTSVLAAPGRCEKAPDPKGTLVVEWPTAVRAALETRAQTGRVVLRHTGCEVEVLEHCYAEGAYAYSSKGTEKQTVSIDGADALYETIPVGASDLEGRLGGGKLTVEMTVAGRYDASSKTVPADELRGECEGATHVVTGWTVGAFEVSGKGGVFHSVGDTDSCVEQKDAQAPPPGCGAPLSLELFALPGADEAAATAAAAAARAEAERAAAEAPAPAAEPPEPKKKQKRTREPKSLNLKASDRTEWKASNVHMGAWIGAGGGLALSIGAFVAGGLLVGSTRSPNGSAHQAVISAAEDSINDADPANNVDPDMAGDLCEAARGPGDEAGGVLNAGVVDACDDLDTRLTASTAMWITGGALLLGAGVATFFVYLTGTKPKDRTARESIRVLAGPARGGAVFGLSGRF